LIELLEDVRGDFVEVVPKARAANRRRTDVWVEVATLGTEIPCVV
jgi:hypothetical protein